MKYLYLSPEVLQVECSCQNSYNLHYMFVVQVNGVIFLIPIPLTLTLG